MVDAVFRCSTCGELFPDHSAAEYCEVEHVYDGLCMTHVECSGEPHAYGTPPDLCVWFMNNGRPVMATYSITSAPIICEANIDASKLMAPDSPHSAMFNVDNPTEFQLGNAPGAAPFTISDKKIGSDDK